MSNLKVSLILEAIDRMTAPIRNMASRVSAFAERMSAAFRRVGDAALNLGKSINNLGKSALTKLTLPIAGLGYASLKSAGNLEDLKLAMETAAGSAELANKEFLRIEGLTRRMPFPVEELITAYIKLKNLGLDPTNEALISYANTASAMPGKSLDQMIEAVADATTGEFERLKEFGIKTRVEGNKVAFTFQQKTTVIKNSAEAIQKYLMDIGNVNFAGAAEKKMAGWNAIIGSLSARLRNLLAIFGDAAIKNLELKNTLDDVIVRIEGLTEWFVNLSPATQKWIFRIAIIIALLGPLAMIVGQLTMGIGMLFTGIGGLISGLTIFAGIIKLAAMAMFWLTLVTTRLSVAFMMTPFGWVTAGISALAVAGYLIVKNWDKIKTAWSGIWDSITTRVQQAVAFIQPLIDRITRGINLLSNNAITRGISSAVNYVSGSSAPSTGGGSDAGYSAANYLSTGTQKVDAGGELRIVIDQQGKAAASVVMNNPGIKTSVNQGVIMGGGL